MDPNQQPTPTPGTNPQPPQPVPQESYAQPTAAPVSPVPVSQPERPIVPQQPTSYAAPSTEYDPNYLDTIAAAPPRENFLSGTFGKLFWVLIGVFVIGVSLIIAFSGKDKTADLQQIAVRLDNFSRVAKTAHKNLKSNNLKKIDADFEGWVTDNQNAAEDLLKKGGVKKTEYSKDMVRSEKKIADDLNAKFEDARLGAILNRVYASTMAAETEKLINMLNTMSKKSASSQVRDFAKNASANLQPIQKAFDTFDDNGN